MNVTSGSYQFGPRVKAIHPFPYRLLHRQEEKEKKTKNQRGKGDCWGGNGMTLIGLHSSMFQFHQALEQDSHQYYSCEIQWVKVAHSNPTDWNWISSLPNFSFFQRSISLSILNLNYLLAQMQQLISSTIITENEQCKDLYTRSTMELEAGKNHVKEQKTTFQRQESKLQLLLLKKTS